jgi:DNA polymerase-3 subunit gamma/tau
MLTGEASNALLKTLEEPPDRVIFVMATTQPEDLEDTIRSRSQHFHFRALTFLEITSRLEYIAKQERLKIDEGALSVIARMAEGSMRDSLSLLEQARAYCGDEINDKEVRELLGVVPEDALNELVESIAAQSAERVLKLVHTFQKEGRNLQHFCREAIRHMRNLLIARVCGADSDLIAATPEQRPALAKAAALFSEEDLTRYFQILLQTDDDVRRKMDPRVHLEMGLLRLINAARLAPLEELLAEVGGANGKTGGASTVRGATTNAVAGASASRAVPVSATATTSRSISGFGFAASKGSANTVTSESGGYATESWEQTRTVSTAGAGLSSGVSAAAAAPAMDRVDAIAPATANKRESKWQPAVTGMSTEQLTEVKTAIQEQQKFIGELLEHTSRWELDGSELRIYFPPEKSNFAELLEGRETLEKMRASSSKVLGRSVRVCARLESGAAKDGNASRVAASTQEMRAQFENDPLVKSMLQRFGGRISEVRRRTED